MLGKMLSVEEKVSDVVKDHLTLYQKCFQTILANFGQHKLKDDLCMESLAYFSLKSDFKQSFLISDIDQVCKYVCKTTYQAFVFMVLNLCRDAFFDSIPSFGLKQKER